jgi:hypothetical protein
LKAFKTNFIADLHKKAKFKVSGAKHPVSPLTFVKLINSTVAPIYKYGIEIIPWNLSEIRSMDTYLRKTARKFLSLQIFPIMHSPEVNLVNLEKYRARKTIEFHGNKEDEILNDQMLFIHCEQAQ